MYAVCAKHLDRAVDEFLAEYETAPDLYDLSQVAFTAWQAPACCNYCGRAPKYLVV
ncbi:MAG TPA: CxxH/CxxC protein [Firmicutes bacterium]|nr:CxxH/CxxC protein [Bacillota bacterium]